MPHFFRLILILVIAPTLAAQTPAPPTPSTPPTPPPAPDLNLSLWADTSLLGSPVALTFDALGRAYVTQSRRRKAFDLDIREHADWPAIDLAHQSVDDKRAFFRKHLDPKNSAQNTWLPDHNQDGSHDWRDLTAGTELIHRIEDTNNDNIADTTRIFADGFDTEVTGVAAGILSIDNQILLTCAPDLWSLTDTTGDGHADQRRSLAHGFGVHHGIGGHDMHGLALGIDGRIYYSIGDKGFNVTTADGVNHRYPNQGGVLRSEIDGSNFQVFAHGLRNPQELAFDDYHNLFSVDNDSSAPGDRERILHIVRNMDAGWRSNWYYYNDVAYQPWMDEGLYLEAYPEQPAYIVPPVAHYSDGPSGFKRNPGAALSEKWRGWFFLGQFKGSPARSLVSAFTLKPKGATFALDQQAVAAKGITATGLAFDPSGALYVAEWMNGWDVSEEGRIWKIDTPASPLRTQTAQLITQGFDHRPDRQLADLLAHADQRVRLASQLQLVKRHNHAILQTIALDTQADTLARVHAIYGLGIEARRQNYDPQPLTQLLNDTQLEIRVATIRNLADHPPANQAPAINAIRALLRDSESRVRFHAALALGQLKDRDSFSALVDLIDREGADAYLRHAATTAIAQLADANTLATLISHNNKYVRAAAVVALRQLKSPLVAAYLDDADPYVASDAARAIHDDFSIPAALPQLATSLANTTHTDEPYLRRAINANLRHNSPDAAPRLANFATHSNAPGAMRALALDTLALFAAPPTFDLVEGRNRPLGARDVQQASSALSTHFTTLMANHSPTPVRIAAVNAAAALNYQNATTAIANFAQDINQPAELRIASLQALAKLNAPQLKAAVTSTLNASDESLRATAQALLPQADPQAAVAQLAATLQSAKSSLREKQAAMLALAELPHADTAPALNQHLDELITGKTEPGLMLELLETAAQSTHPGVQAKLATFNAARANLPPTDQYTETLSGGSHTEGRKIFNTHPAAQCARCHIINNVGGAIGPDLTTLATRSDKNQILQSIVEPGAAIAEGFGLITLILKNADPIAGIVQAETDNQLTLVTLDNQKHTVTKSTITQRTPPISAMPPMAAVLSKREVRDLVAYLARLK